MHVGACVQMEMSWRATKGVQEKAWGRPLWWLSARRGWALCMSLRACLACSSSLGCGQNSFLAFKSDNRPEVLGALPPWCCRSLYPGGTARVRKKMLFFHSKSTPLPFVPLQAALFLTVLGLFFLRLLLSLPLLCVTDFFWTQGTSLGLR